MSTVTPPPVETGGTASEVAVRAREVARHYGEGATAVRLRVSTRLRSERSPR